MQNNITEYPIDEYKFKYHKKYFEQLKASLEPFNIHLERVHETISNSGTSFTVYSNSIVVWKKIASKGICAHNFLYVGKEKMKLYDWLGLSEKSREQILNSQIEN